MKVETKHTGH